MSVFGAGSLELVLNVCNRSGDELQQDGRETEGTMNAIEGSRKFRDALFIVSAHPNAKLRQPLDVPPHSVREILPSIYCGADVLDVERWNRVTLVFTVYGRSSSFMSILARERTSIAA